MNKTRLIILSIILVVLTTITYSALATNLAITGEATIRAVSDIRVTDIDLDKAENDAVEEYAPKYTKNTVTNGIKLPSSNSSITYTVEITNKGDIDQAIYGISTVSNNSGLHILINGEEINSALPMIIPYRTTREITITYWASTPSNEVINIVNTIDFREVYYITYNTKGGSEVQRQIKYQNVDINLTQERPTKTGYVFTGWTDEQNGTQVKYTPGNLYTLNSNKTLYAIYRYGEATFVDGPTFNVAIKQLANPNLNDITVSGTNDENITSIQRYTSGVPSAATLENAVKVSTNTSEIDIYAWHTNGTIYYYTEAFNPYMNADAGNMFRALTKVTSIDLSTIDTSRTNTMHAMFLGCNSLTSIDLSNFNTGNVTNMSYMLYECSLLENITFENNFDTSNVINISYMFYRCSSLTNLNLSRFNTSKVINMKAMFYACSKLLTLDLSGFNTISVTNMNRMFTGCNSLTSIIFGSNFNTSNVTDMGDMFSWCRNLVTLDLSHFNTSKVTNMDFMFEYCDKLTSINLGSFNTSLVSNMEAMFISCKKLAVLDISNFDMHSVNNVLRMFDDMPALTSLKTPSVYPTDLTITLPKTLYDPSGNGYSTLATGNPTQTWIKLGYTVVFDKNHSDATGTMNNQIIQFDTDTNLHANTYKRYRYVFTGWNTQANGSGTAYLDEASVNALTTANGTITLYAQWREGEATFIPGTDFNIAIKQLANPLMENINHETYDSNIISVQQYTGIPSQNILNNAETMSTNNSDFDIYVWYDNGTIYYYSEAINLYMNSNGTYMFRKLNSVTNIDLSTINTSRTTQMGGMFEICPNLTTIDLSSLDTSNVLYMQYMFSGCNNLNNIVFGNAFDTSKVTNMSYMFANCNTISSLDLSSFNMNLVSNTTNMLYNISSLEQLKTPSVIPSGLTITLPKTLYDENGNAYTQLDSTTPTQTWLRKTYVVTFDTNKGNLVYGLNDTDGYISNGRTEYSISNGSIEVRSLVDDAWATTIGRVYLKSNKSYIFNCNSSGIWASNSNENGNVVEAYIGLNGSFNSGDFLWIGSNVNYEFTVLQTGTYWVRLDVNQAGQTHTFSNISIVEKNETKSVIYNQQYGTLPTNPTREGYAFVGWNGKNLFNVNDIYNGWLSDEGTLYENTAWKVSDFILVDSDYDYVFSYVNEGNVFNQFRYGIFDNNKNVIGVYAFTSAGTDYSKIIELPSNAKYIRLNYSINVNYNPVARNNIQFEKSTEATAYEPYYITSSTTVVQDKDHTLTAKWIPNTYSVVFDKNDNDATGTMNNQSMTYGTSSNLTKNTYKKTGYVFMGWNTASDGSGIAYLDEASVNALTPTNNGSITLYAQWREGEATFVDGSTFNVAIKQLANPTVSDITYETFDTNITSIEKYTNLPTQNILDNAEVVSTQDSDYDIYIWYENETIYYYTETVNLYMNSVLDNMYRGLRRLSQLDITEINTSKVTRALYMFVYCSLTSIDLSNFNTSNMIHMGAMFESSSFINLDLSNFNTANVENMSYMFSRSSNLKNINFGNNFKTENVTTMWGMFNYCTSLKILDISNFDMKNVNNVTSFVNTISTLEQLKTPSVIPSGLTITLPKTMYDENGNAYTQLDNNSPTEEWLRIPYTVTFDSNKGNLLQGLEDKETTQSMYMEYSIENGVVTVTALRDDGWGHTPGRIELEANKTYIFNCDMDASYGVSGDTQQVFLLLNGSTNAGEYIQINSNENFEFTPTISGTYWLRLDVNQSGQTHTFSNISVIEKNTTKEVIYGQPYGTLPDNPTREGYQFAGWNGKNLINIDELKNVVISGGVEQNGGGYWLSSDYIKKESDNYTFSFETSHRYVQFYFVYYDSNKNYISAEGVNQNIDSNTFSYTTNMPNNVSYFKIQYSIKLNGIGDVQRTKVQLEENSTATIYEPYYIIPSTTVVQDKDHILTAKWIPNTYSIVFDKNDNAATGTMNNQSMTYGTSSNLTKNTYKKTGYVFMGWNTASDGSGTAYLDEASVSNLTVVNGGTLTLYAQWIKNPTITFDNNYQANNLVNDMYNLNFRNNYGGSQTKEIVYDSEINDYVIKLTITSLPNNGTSTCIYVSIPINDSSLVHTWQLFAKSSKSITNSYYLGIEQNGHYGPQGTYVEYSTNWIRFDKTFTPTSGVINTAFYVIFTSGLQVGDSVYLYGISLEEGDNSSNQTVVTKNYGSTLGTLPTEPTREGYVFDGWYTDPVGGTKISTSTVATTDTTYYAHWLSTDPEARIRSTNALGTSIADDDPDNNLRYIGANPNNYVTFNGNQKWRIIGVIDGKLKLVQDSIGNYSWDTSKETVNRGLGVNEWSQADLMKLLNPGYETNTDLKCKTNTTYVSDNGDGYPIINCGDNSSSAYEDTNPLVNNSLYWNAGNGLCYTYGNYQASACNFTTTGLSDTTSKNMIDNAIWHLGSNDKDADLWGAGQIMTANYIYNMERSNYTGKQCSNAYYCSDTVARTTPPTWTGKVGLIYPSDYAYATGGGTTNQRDVCLGKQVGYVNSSSTPNWANTYTDCKDNNWLLNKSAWTWSLSPLAYASNARYVFNVGSAGHVYNSSTMNAGSVRPTVYLKSGVEIVNGNGSYNTPFTLRLVE